MLLLAVLAQGCELSGATTPNAREVVGVWEFTATQSAPATTLTGELVISGQSSGLFTGIANWDERDGLGAVVSSGGPLMGRVLTESDVDFDVTIAGIERRHVGRLVADTITGTWAQASNGRSGQFRAVLSTP